MADSRLEEMDRRIADMRKRLEAAQQIRAAIEDDPELLGFLVSDNGATAASQVPYRPAKVRSAAMLRGGPIARKYFEKAAEFISSKGNQPQTIPDIARATSLKESNVIQVFYRTHAVLVESQAIPGHKSRKQWKLRPGWREILDSQEK